MNTMVVNYKTIDHVMIFEEWNYGEKCEDEL